MSKNLTSLLWQAKGLLGQILTHTSKYIIVIFYNTTQLFYKQICLIYFTLHVQGSGVARLDKWGGGDITEHKYMNKSPPPYLSSWLRHWSTVRQFMFSKFNT